MIDFGFNEVCGLPVSFDNKINDGTDLFAFRVRYSDDDFFHFICGFDRTAEGKWLSVILRDENGECILYDSMKDVCEAIVGWHKSNRKEYLRNDLSHWSDVYIEDDRIDWDDED